jgi:ubiquinone/menaquinone biosynthesis C-methylase UbiE
MHSPERIRDANVRYHDLAAEHYDSKWGINYNEVGQAQVTGKLRKALGHELGRYDRALEIGAGTGYFTLNLLRAGVVRDAVATDISPGMLARLERSAEELGLSVETAACEASELPYDDDSFDLVLGHAVLHHLPDLPGAFREFRRVLRPGGVVAFCGEPSHYGDRLAAWPKRGASAVAPLWRALMGAGPRPSASRNGHVHTDEEDHLEQVVDIHAFTPAQLSSHAEAAGFESVRVSGEELVAGLFGWANRTLESTANPLDVPWAWRVYAYRGYLLLQTLDRSLLEPHLPPALFYNLLISARNGAQADRVNR